MKYFNSAGVEIRLGEQIGRGGEGTVYHVVSDPAMVAKLYHEAIDDEKAGKLVWMAEHKNDQLLKVAAWIVDTLHDDSSDRRIVGFMMPNVRAKEIHELYSLKSRRIHFPDATWKYLVHTAANVARAFYNLHRNDHVMGDVNHGNCVVLRDGTVKLIDCDSYSISRGDFRYKCDVGVATHLAPELQGRDLGEVVREANHDNFGLAVIIFQLLFLGRHPFAGMFLGEEDKALEDCIREKRFAWGDDAEARMVRRPPGTLALAGVGQRLASLFNRAFLTETRPGPKEWIEALEDLSESLAQCATHAGHFYFKELPSCPWCGLEMKTGLMLFPFVGAARAAGEESFNIFTVENLVNSIAPTNMALRPVKSSILPPPSKEADELRRSGVARFVTLAVIHFVIVVFLTAIGGAGVGFFIGALVMAAFIVTLNNSSKNNKGDLETRLEEARAEWNQVESDWDSADIMPQLKQDIEAVRNRIAEHHKLSHASRDKAKLVREEVFRYRLDMYLASHKIAEAEVDGLSQRRAEMLAQEGVRTAADLIGPRLKQIGELSTGLRTKLLDWRAELERKFEFDPNEELAATELQRLNEDFGRRRSGIEREIEHLIGGLRGASTIVRQRQQNLTERARAAAEKLLQSESDIAAAGNITAPIIVLIMITTIVPFFGGVFSATNSRPQSFTSPSSYGRGTSDAPLVKTVPAPGYIAPEKLTDADIQRLTPSERAAAVKQFVERANRDLNGTTSIETEKKRAEVDRAKERIATALRIEPNHAGALQLLGHIQFIERKFNDSIETLNRVLAIDSSNTEARFDLARNYIEIRYFDDARRILDDLVSKEDTRFEFHYNRGLAYKGLNQPAQASTSFKAATRINNYDPLAHYQIALMAHKIGPAEEVVAEYRKVLALDQDIAAKLRREIGLKNVPTKQDDVNAGSELSPPPKAPLVIKGSDMPAGNGTGTGVGTVNRPMP